MRKKPLFLLLASLLPAALLLAQSPVSVNPVTGTAGVTIPVYTVSSGQVSVPVYIQYTASGVKVKDVEGTAGMNFNLFCSGQISRLVRNLPDDCTADSAGTARYGWMSSSNTAAAFAAGFIPQNDGNFSTCTDETKDIDSIDTRMPVNYDTEPDLFYVNAPGLSCQLVYNRADSSFHPIGYQDLVIQFTKITAAGHHKGNIIQFTITNDRGIKYVFGKADTVTQTTVLGSGGTATYFNTKYQQYQHAITYAASWNLVSITDPYNNAVNFSYTTAPARNSADPVWLYIGGSPGTSVQYTVQQKYTPQALASIGTSSNAYTITSVLSFSWQTFNGTHQSGQTAIDQITGMGHTFQFNYNPVVSTTSSAGFTRNFLASYTDAGCGSPVNYQFGYVGQTGPTSGVYYTALPDSGSTNYDYWGYYSTSAGSGTGVIPYVYVYYPGTSIYPRYTIGATGSPGSGYSYLRLGSNSLQVTPSTVATGTLNQITYPQGGTTTIAYESNDYYDPAALTTIQGGGIRVKQITDATGSGATNNMVRTYTYNTPGSSNSSGQPVTLPQYAFTVPYGGSATGTTLYTDATAISPVDLSTEDHTILYDYVTVSQYGAGKTVNHYSNPDTYWSSGFGAVADIARYTCSNYGPIGNFANWYPFIPNPNDDYLRGLLVKTTNYADGGAEMSETNYTYQSLTSPVTITAFRGENNGSSSLQAKSYNTYPIYYNTLQAPATVNTIVYDSNNQSSSQSTTVTYTYGSANHKLLTQMQTANSDGSTVTANYSYAKDFTGASVQTDPNITAVYNLQQQNINAPIESYTQVTTGGTTVTTAAALTYYRDTTIASATRVVPSRQFKWISPNGGTFTPLIITGSTITKNTNYFGVLNYDAYDKTGFPLTTDDNTRHFQTTVLDHFSGMPTAVFKNANYSQVAFSDFDSDPGASTTGTCYFSISGTQAFIPTTSHAGNAYGLGSTQTATSPTLNKNSTAVNYIFSIWTNAASGTLTVTAAGNTYPITLSGSVWKYNEVSIPASVFTGSTVSVTFASTANVAIDDILLYPDCAEAATVTYDATQHHKLAETNTNGVSSYFTYDQWGRLLFQFDQDKNIVLKKAYITPGNITDFTATLNSSTGSSITTSTPFTLTATGGDPCTAAANVYTFDFGDGSSTVTSTSAIAPVHTYTTVGSYTATVTINSDYFPTKTASVSFTVTAVSSVPLHYVNNCTSKGDITTVLFYQGGVLKYTVPVASLNSTSVTPGVYNITVNMNSHDILYNSLGDGTGYQSVEILGASDTWCFNYSSGGTFNYNGVDLTASTSITFEANTTSCGM